MKIERLDVLKMIRIAKEDMQKDKENKSNTMTLKQQKKEARKEFDEKFPISHYYCEDCWYSCPKSKDGCCDNSQGDECNCNAEIEQEKLKAFIDSLIDKLLNNNN